MSGGAAAAAAAGASRPSLLAPSSVHSLLNNLRQQQHYDYIRAAANAELTKYLTQCAKSDGATTNEVVLFADEVIKINRKQKRQERVLIVTDRAIYNFQSTSSFKAAKRRILVKVLRGVILSRCSDELVLQVDGEYDYRYDVRRRSELLEMLARAFEVANPGSGMPLMVTFSDAAELRDHVITKDVLQRMQQAPAASLSPRGNGTHTSTAPAGAHTPHYQQHRRAPSLQPAHMHEADPGSSPSPPASSHSPHSPSHSMVSASASAACGRPMSYSMSASQQRHPYQYHTMQPPNTPKSASSPNFGTLPRTPKNVRRSQITHGSALLPPAVLASIAANRANASAGVPPAVHESEYDDTVSIDLPPHAAASAPGPSNVVAVSPLPSPTSAAYRMNKKASIFATLRGGSAGRPSVTVASQSGVQLVWRDPSSRVEGWLTKKKGSGKKWDRKYFVLTHTHLQYYSPCVKSSAKLELGTVTVARGLTDEAAADACSSDGNLFILRLESRAQKEPLILALASEEEAQAWSDALLHRNSIESVDDLDAYPHMEGWVLHRERSSSSWARRYVVLTADRVWFIEMGLKGNIDCSKGVSAHDTHEVEATEPPQQTSTFAGRGTLTRFAYRWNVSDSERIFYLAADSQEDMSHWIACIDLVNREHGKAGSAAHAEDNDSEGDEGALASASLTNAVALPEAFLNAVTQPAPEGQVTFVFTDVQSSTMLWDKVPDAMDQALSQHDRLLRELLLLYRGHEVKTEGDAFMVTFFTSLEAVLWCMHVQIALNEAEWSDDFCAMPSARRESAVDPATGASVRVFNGIRIRMGVHTGHPAARRNPVTGRMDYFGQVVNRSARVSDTGHGGQIVATQEVVDALRLYMSGDVAAAAAVVSGGSVPPADALERLAQAHMRPIITDQGAHDLKGINEPVRIYEIKPTRLALRTLPPLRV